MSFSLRFCLCLGICLAALSPLRAQTGDPAKVLHTFSGPDGASPSGALIQGSDGNFYGTTETGGATNNGTIFQLTPKGVLTTLFSFSGVDGSRPSTALIETSNGGFYGTTLAGGPAYTSSNPGGGTVFRFSAKGKLKTLYSFNVANEVPVSLVLAGDGTLYGATSGVALPAQAGQGLVPIKGGGTVFSLTREGVLTTLHSFRHQVGPLVLAHDGNVYGTTTHRAMSYTSQGYVALYFGYVFQITPAGVLTVVYSFAPGERLSPTLSFEGTDGALYGTGSDSGLGENGEVFRLTTDGVFSVILDEDGLAIEESLLNTLVQGQDGNFYGLAEFTQITNVDVITTPLLYQLTPAGVLTAINQFSTSIVSFSEFGDRAGQLPVSLLQGKNGSIYATTVDAAGSIVRVKLLADTVSLGLTGSASSNQLIPTTFQAGGPDVKINVSRVAADLSHDLSVILQFSGTATNGVDYTGPDGQPVSGTVVIPAGQATAELDLKTVANAAQMGNLSFFVQIAGNPDENYLISNNLSVSLTFVEPQ